MMRSRALSLAGWFVSLGLVLGLCIAHFAPLAEGQPFEDETSPAYRAKLMAQLNDEISGLEEHGLVLKTAVKLIKPTVAHIEARKRTTTPTGFGRQSEETGSGVLVELDGQIYVLTNNHVIQGAAEAQINISLADGRVYHPTAMWHDGDTDVAVLKINGTGLVAAPLGNSDAVEIGDFVLAVGSPFGLSHSVTFGIISAKGRRDLELGDSVVRFQDFMQTDAAINPGNSGGPLLDLRGRVIGINTAIASSSGGNEGIGFTIPVNMVVKVARQLIAHGSVQRAFLGVNLDRDFDAEDARRVGLNYVRGARIVGITPDSPAAKVNLRVDDVVVTFDGVRVDDDAHLVNLVGLTPIGKDVPVTVWRDGKPLEIKVQVGDRSRFGR